MNASRRIEIAIFIIFFITVSCNHIFLAFADEEAKEFIKNEENPSLPMIIWRILGETFPPSSLELIRTAMHKIKMKFHPPNLDFRPETEGDDAGKKVKEAAKKSLGTSKETIEESAKMAGGVVGEAVQKVRNKASDANTEDLRDEL